MVNDTKTLSFSNHPSLTIDEQTYLFIQESLETSYFNRKENAQNKLNSAEAELAKRQHTNHINKQGSTDGDIIEQSLLFMIGETRRNLAELEGRYNAGKNWVKAKYESGKASLNSSGYTGVRGAFAENKFPVNFEGRD